MAAFAPGQVHVTTAPFIQVDPLPTGTYRFRLEVVDQAGNVSAPAERQVTVLAPQRPQPTPTPIPRPPIGRIPLEPLEDRTSRIPIYKRPGGGLEP